MSYTSDKARSFESTKTSSKEIATKILKKREGEIALGLFKVGWPGERMTFASLCGEFLSSHTSTLSAKSQRNHRMYLNNLREHFGGRQLTEIQRRLVEEYRDYRADSRQSATRRRPSREPRSTASLNICNVCSSLRSNASTSLRAPLPVWNISTNAGSGQQSEC
jgi:hypothetical protein